MALRKEEWEAADPWAKMGSGSDDSADESHKHTTKKNKEGKYYVHDGFEALLVHRKLDRDVRQVGVDF